MKIALEAIVQNKLRGFLTSLGIICGVASVIAMLAIGNGAEQAIVEKMKLLGTNNIIIKPIIKTEKEKEQQAENTSDKKERNNLKYSPGLTLADADAIQKFIPEVNKISSEIVYEATAANNGFITSANIVGINENFVETNAVILKNGKIFNQSHFQTSGSVCMIGAAVKKNIFPGENPLGKRIKCDEVWFTVLGVLPSRSVSEENTQSMGLRNFDNDVYIPESTMLLRLRNRSKVSRQSLKRGPRDGVKSIININQIDKMVVSVHDSKNVKPISKIINKMLKRRHNNLEDFQVIVPELLLKQEQDTKRIFNIVLSAIASISLLVGGIGIMNIMLASVLERTKEIGIRMAIGAKQNDILQQFLIEAVAISLSGGIIGIIVGITTSYVIEFSTDISTIVSTISVFISFIVSISVGLIFGIFPAKRASEQSPIDLLRYE